MNSLQWLMLLTLSVLWGGSFFFVEVAIADMPPLLIVLGRVAGAAAVLQVLLLFTRLRMPASAGAWLRFVPMSLLNNVIPFLLIVWAQTRITSGLASILNATTPIFTLILAHYLTADERLTAPRIFGALTALGGVVILIGPSVLEGLGLDALAQLAVIGAAVSYAFAGVYGRRFGQQPPLITACGQLTVSSLLLVPVAVFVNVGSAAPWTPASTSALSWAAIGGLAVLSTAVAYLLYFRLLASAGAGNLLLVTFLLPVSAVALGTGVLGEVLSTRELGGMACVGLGLLIIDGRLHQRLWRLASA